MEVIRAQKGKNKGGISVTRTLATMRMNEKWRVSASAVNIGYVREAASKFARLYGREFTVSHTAEAGDIITITRIA